MYRLDSRDSLRWATVEVGSNGRQFTVTGLSSEQTYVFRLIARTAVGWGEEWEALVVTTERRGKRQTYLSFEWCLNGVFAVISVSLAVQLLSIP